MVDLKVYNLEILSVKKYCLQNNLKKMSVSGRLHIPKLKLKMSFGLQEIDYSFLQLLFLVKKSSQSRWLFGQDGQPPDLAIKTPVLIPHQRARPVPARYAVIPPHFEHMEFSFRWKTSVLVGSCNNADIHIKTVKETDSLRSTSTLFCI